jgi:transcriptional regulator with XRE-family HTH domain
VINVVGRLWDTSGTTSTERSGITNTMANERLRAALLQRGITPAELAEVVGVDPKTIERWIGGRAPYRRHRYLAARELGLDEAYLWPGALAAEQVASASESEILLVYPHRWVVPRDTWGQFFDSAEGEIGVLAYSGMFIADDPGLRAMFRAKAEQGVRIRLLLGDPDSAVVAERGVQEGIEDSLAAKIRNAVVLYRELRSLDSVEMRLHSTILYNSIYRADDDVLVNAHIYGTPASEAPVMHLRRVAGGSMITTYLDSFDRVWSQAKPFERPGQEDESRAAHRLLRRPRRSATEQSGPVG